MKKALTIAGLLSLMALPVWGGGVGVMYSGWDTDEASDDQGVGVKIKFDVGSAVDFEIRTAWLEGFEFSTQGELFKLEANPVDVGLSYGFRPGANVQPYLGGGFSFVFLNGKVADDSRIRVDDEAGFYVVGGVEGAVTDRFTVFGEVMHRDMSAEVTSDGFLNRDFTDFGVDLGGLAFNFGVMLSW